MPDIRADNNGVGFSPAVMYAAARMYYEEELSQQQIADRLGIYRTTVSRLLQQARDSNIVRIDVVEPPDVFALSVELERALGLRRVVVAQTASSVGSASVDSAEHLTTPALRELAGLELKPGNVLGVSWGNAVLRVASAPGEIELPDIELIPLLGGLEETDPRFQNNEIVRLLGQNTGANVNFVHLPARLAGRSRALLKEPPIAHRLAMWDHLDAALVGIGSVEIYQQSAGPHLLESERNHFRTAVGDVAARYFTKSGSTVRLPDENAIVGVTREQLKKAGTVLGVAAGAAKASAIIGAARAGLIDVLVTDSLTADAIRQVLAR